MSNRYKGGFITATPPTTTGGDTGSASGNWTTTQQMQAQAAGNWPSPPPPPYIEDVFSTYLYTGNGSTQTITNGINLSTKGGLVWVKARQVSADNELFDTARGAYYYLSSNTTDASTSLNPNGVTAFNTTGFSVKDDSNGSNGVNGASGGTFSGTPPNYVSWTFRKQPKFFDIVTYTGTGTNRTVSHNLGSTPGCIITKKISSTGEWLVYHRSQDNYAYTTRLNSTAGQGTLYTAYSATPTSTQFSVDGDLNTNGATYVAYLFAHDAGGFGENLDQNVISCGSYTESGSGATVNLGYEPQFVMIKRTSGLGDWIISDNMRGWSMTSNNILKPNSSNAEVENGNDATTYFIPTSTGFKISSGYYITGTYIYIAIRRGPMKTPTTGTSVFSPVAYTGDSSGARYFSDYGFPLDMLWYKRRNGTDASAFSSRLTGGSPQLVTSSTAAETNLSNIQLDRMLGFYTTSTFQNALNETGATVASGGFRRAPGFFDVVCYTGTGSATNISHNLGVAPEMVIVKRRSSAGASWYVAVGNTNIYLNYTYSDQGPVSWWGPTTYQNPTSTTFSVGDQSGQNGSGSTYVAYLFATVAGVSKVGSYTGTGSTQQVNCGFTGGARFVMIKRTDSTGDWYVWDSARGIVAGNDPYLLLNSTAAEVTNTDYVDTYSAGFEISSTAPAAINANGGSFIYLAIA